MSVSSLGDELAQFSEFGQPSRCFHRSFAGASVPYFVNEFWTARQRAAHSLHEISYRACFKPQLPRFFITRLTTAGGTVYDPFMGRGTSVLEAALLGREAVGCDVNPLSRLLLAPRLRPPRLAEVQKRLSELSFEGRSRGWKEDLTVFFHPKTLTGLRALQRYFREKGEEQDAVDHWLRMVATNRLTGHSVGFFSVYTLPPNQAASLIAQRKINAKRHQVPEPRDIPAILAKKSRLLLKHVNHEEDGDFLQRGQSARLFTGNASRTPELATASVDLIVTSPPFLDVVDYQGDNWLRCWFNGINASKVPISRFRRVSDWQAAMEKVLRELVRVLKPGGHLAFEVGEVKKGAILLEDHAIPAGRAAGLAVELVLVNQQSFTKTANCWGVDNLSKGTNTNRIVLFRKPPALSTVSQGELDFS
ncbi:DNA methyltransferase [Roseibacillus ishigakijimensis]|uniref:site-specific DNA-methyltransferase (cytosine-N(4)-specific) n=1 Tax=Roseibacillus ishigakijimensis TaxID=454146 RepID=A0A934RQ43_9BACT|nr:DNA methyltransferase [Roseibacillus ishigakijimensis]MBK1834910.1 hypothetical protein [Roseibacillus ishigakijimensis]